MNTRKRPPKDDKLSSILTKNCSSSSNSKIPKQDSTRGVTETNVAVSHNTSRMSGGFSGLSETCNLSRRQASILSKKRAAEELEQARQQAELEAEAEAEAYKKAKREQQPVVVAWSETDKDVFFQGVLTCGRDFDKLHKFCMSKIKAKDLGERSKDQIRYFYYRTVRNLQCVQKRVSCNKEANELFAVVNWAEFRRRKILNPLKRHTEYLTQLIYNGETKFRHKGKQVKMRTPSCAPLNRLFEKAREEAAALAAASTEKKKAAAPVYKKPRLPEYITVELQPKSNAAWQRVSDISHNPHLRVKVKCEQSLSTLIETVEKKWVPSSVRFRRELNLEEDWDRLPYIKVHPTSQAKLQPFDISQASSHTQTVISFNEYLKLTKEDSDTESMEDEPEDEKVEKDGDPAKFLKDKLTNITAQLQGESSNDGETPPPVDPETKSHQWIAEAQNGWTAGNSKDLSMGCLYLLFGSPEKLVLDYEWPELERADEVVHMFAGMINRLINIAENEFTTQNIKKKHINSLQNSPTNRSPSARGRARSSPSTPKSLLNIKPAPSKDSPEFKKPGIPMQSENRQLADAIALGRKELRPYFRRTSSRPVLVQKKILPNPYTLMNKQLHHMTSIPGATSAGKTQLMDISCITVPGSGVKYNIAPKVQSSSKPATQPTSPVKQSALQSLISSHNSHDISGTSTNNHVMSSLANLISSTPGSDRAANEFNQLQSLISAVSNEDSQSMDILTQAMASIKTPVKRRITPMTISTTVDGQVFHGTQARPTTATASANGIGDGVKSHNLNDSISEHSLSSLLKSFGAGNHHTTEEALIDGGLEHHSSPISNPTGFQGLINGSAQSKPTDNLTAANDVAGLPAETVNDAWLTPDIALSDFSLSSFLGSKSPRQEVTDPSAMSGGQGEENPHSTTAAGSTCSVVGGVLLPDRPASILGSDDTRMSFLNKLDVSDLGMVDSTLPHLMGGDSVDYMAKFESLASSLDTPQKKL